jgi:hypothetical protein
MEMAHNKERLEKKLGIKLATVKELKVNKIPRCFINNVFNKDCFIDVKYNCYEQHLFNEDELLKRYKQRQTSNRNEYNKIAKRRYAEYIFIMEQGA